MDDIKIAAGYVRVSTDSQEEYSPDSQIKLIRDYAKREGYVIPDEYIFRDDGISGKSADKRPAFRLMIATAKEENHPFDAIFVWKYSRFARNQEEAIMYKNLLRKKGIDVRSISEPSNDSPFSSLIERIIEWMDEYYLINLAHEVRRGMTEKAARGEAMGTAPFGYSVKDKTLIPNDSAEIIRWIFEQYASGKGARAIATELNNMGVKTRRGNPIDNRWVTYVLSNPAYIGKIRWSTDGKANYSRASYNGENVLITDGKHEPIISLDLWEAVQQKLSQRPTDRYKRKAAKEFMLKGLCRCSACGSTLTLQRDSYLQCHKYSRGQCSVSHCLSLKKANAAVISALEDTISNGTYRFSQKKLPRSAPKRDWDRLIISEQDRLKRAKYAFLDGIFSAEEYKAAKADIEETIGKLQAAKEAEKPKDADVSELPTKIIEILKIIKSPDISEDAKNTALRSIIDKIVYIKPDNVLEIYFAP